MPGLEGDDQHNGNQSEARTEPRELRANQRGEGASQKERSNHHDRLHIGASEHAGSCSHVRIRRYRSDLVSVGKGVFYLPRANPFVEAWPRRLHEVMDKRSQTHESDDEHRQPPRGHPTGGIHQQPSNHRDTTHRDCSRGQGAQYDPADGGDRDVLVPRGAALSGSGVLIHDPNATDCHRGSRDAQEGTSSAAHRPQHERYTRMLESGREPLVNRWHGPSGSGKPCGG